MQQRFSHPLAEIPIAMEGEVLNTEQKEKRLKTLRDKLKADIPKLDNLSWCTIKISEVVRDGCLCAVVNLVGKAYMNFSMAEEETRTIRRAFLSEVQEVRRQMAGASDRIHEAVTGAREPAEHLAEGDDLVTVSALRRRMRQDKSDFSRIIVPAENGFREVAVNELPIYLPRGDVIEISARICTVDRHSAEFGDVCISRIDRPRVASIPGVLACTTLRRQRLSPMHVDHGTALQRAMDCGHPVKLLVVLCLRWVDGACDSFVLVEDQPGLLS